MFHRTIITLLRETSRNWPVLLLTGPRQVGKSSVLLALREPERTVVSLDDLALRALAVNDPAAFIQRFPPPVLIDEVQYAPQLFPFIKIWVDDQRAKSLTALTTTAAANPAAGAFWLTGSQKFRLMQDVQETLAGRVAILDLLGFSQAELDASPARSQPFFPPAGNTPNTNTAAPAAAAPAAPAVRSLMDVFRSIWLGSFPELRANPAINRDLFFKSYIQTYIERDVKDFYGIESDLKFHRFIRAAAVRTGNLVNFEDLARDCDIDRRTAQAWLDILLRPGLAYLLPPHEASNNKRLVKTPKLYFLDTGLACYLAGLDSPEALEASYLSGAMLETHVLCELLKSFWHNGKDPIISFYRDTNQKEIDFILERNLTLYPIEVKKTASPTAAALAAVNRLSATGKTIGAGTILCFHPTIHPLPNSNAVSMPIWAL
jgi:predicted AAA+ superfamily ATPase